MHIICQKTIQIRDSAPIFPFGLYFYYKTNRVKGVVYKKTPACPAVRSPLVFFPRRFMCLASAGTPMGKASLLEPPLAIWMASFLSGSGQDRQSWVWGRARSSIACWGIPSSRPHRIPNIHAHTAHVCGTFCRLVRKVLVLCGVFSSCRACVCRKCRLWEKETPRNGCEKLNAVPDGIKI